MFMFCSKDNKMSVKSRNSNGEEIEGNAPPRASSLSPSTSKRALGFEAREALMEMMGHVMGHGRHDETVRL